jgi:hypothetical protein
MDKDDIQLVAAATGTMGAAATHCTAIAVLELFALLRDKGVLTKEDQGELTMQLQQHKRTETELPFDELVNGFIDLAAFHLVAGSKLPKEPRGPSKDSA